MSHQDKDGRTVVAYNFQALRDAVSWLLKAANLSAIKFREDCTWSTLGLIVTALFWAWSDEPTLTRRFNKARKIALKVLGRSALGKISPAPATSYQAFMKLLRTWSPRLVEVLTEVFRGIMRTQMNKRFKIFGFAVFAVDGSRAELPRTKSNEERYSPQAPKKKGGKRFKAKRRNGGRQRKTRRLTRSEIKARQKRAVQKKLNCPQMWLTVLWHVSTGLPWAWKTGPSDSSERHHAREMLIELPEKSLLVADAGFTGYEFWKAVLDAGHHFVIRVGSNVRLLKNLGYVREREGLVYLWPDKTSKKGQPPLVLRLVVAQKGRSKVYLVTSVLDRKRLSDKQVVELYRLRWGIELYYRHLKQTFNRRKLRSTSPDNAEIEANWSILGLWAMSLHAEHVLIEHRIDPKRLSIAKTLDAYRQVMREHKCRPDEGESLTELLRQALVDPYKRASKASRDYPRKKQEPAAGPPKIRRATREQIERARSLATAA